MKLRNAVHSSTNYSPNELIGLINPIIESSSFEQESMSSAVSFNFSSDFKSEEDWIQCIKRLQEARLTAVVNDIQSRDKRLATMNQSRKPASFKVDQWVHIAQPNQKKTALQISKAHLIISTPTQNNNYYIVQDPETGKHRNVGVQLLRHATDSVTTTQNKQQPKQSRRFKSEEQGQQPRAALVSISRGKFIEYHIIDYRKKSTNGIYKTYTNTRPNSQPAQANWKLNSAYKVTDPVIMEVFQFVKSKQQLLTIPFNVRKKYPDLKLINKITSN
jgi:hypothetical protein